MLFLSFYEVLLRFDWHKIICSFIVSSISHTNVYITTGLANDLELRAIISNHFLVIYS